MGEKGHKFLPLHLVPSEGDSCSVEDNDDGELDETELEKLFAMDRISGVVERALVSLVGSMEESCADGFRCSSEGTCEPIEGTIEYVLRLVRACMGSDIYISVYA